MSKLACVLAVALTAAEAAGDDLDKQLLDVDHRFANRLAALALKAEKQKQAATARCLYGRALDLQADQPAARKALGYTRRGGAWERSAAASADIESRENADPVRVGALRAERAKIEELRAEEVLRVLRKCDAPDRKRPILLALLRYVPRLDAVHAALDHEMIGDRRVRPELAALARALPERLAAWEACREPDSVSEAGAVAIAGIDAMPSFSVGGRRVASVFGKDETARLAGGASCASKMVRLMLGEDAAVWDPSPVYFLSEKQYIAFVHARHESEVEREQKLRAALYVGADCTALAARDVAGALDLYCHCVGFHTIRLLAKAKPGVEECAWLMEGYGLHLSLDLFDSAETWFVSGGESAGKTTTTLPLPARLTRAACLAHVRDQLYDGSLPPLREIVGNTLNNLDKTRALQAWTFVRFLALYDPEASRSLPGALRGRTEDSKVGRSEGALQEAFGIDVAQLDSLWQAYLLELA